MVHRSQLKREAKDILRGAQVSPYLFTLLLMALLLLLSAVDSFSSGSYVKLLQQLFPANSLPPFLLRMPTLSPAAATFASILTLLVSTVLQAGKSIYHLGIRQGREMPYSTLFDAFSLAGRVIVLSILEGIFITLWSFLFFIPGIIAAYRYRFALYNMLENPQLSPLEAISMSKAQTYGFKMDLFVLDLSFLGWILLNGLTFGVLTIWVAPYMAQSDVGFFQAIKAQKGIGARPEEADAAAPW